MDSKSRVRNSILRRPVDRVPIFMWFHPESERILSEAFSVPSSSLDTIFCNDVRQAWVNNNHAMEGIVHERDGETHTDAWGITWERQHFFNQIKEYPLHGASTEEILAYRFPLNSIDELVANMEGPSRKEEFFLGADVSPCAFEMYWRLRGMEEALLDFINSPGVAEEMIRRCVDFSINLAEKVLEKYPIDWLWTGDDVASQLSMILSPEMWRKFIKPHLARLFARAKERGVFTAYHCCGALRPIIPDLIEIGMDVLNPVQPNCPGMDPAELKKEFGRDVTFMGGLDTQHLIPHGGPEEIYDFTQRFLDEMAGDGGGYILAASHTIPPETPLDNILSLYRAVGIEEDEINRRIEAHRA
jgi:uroporphyrinogen decarboxylase